MDTSTMPTDAQIHFEFVYQQFSHQGDTAGMYLTLAAAIQNLCTQKQNYHFIDVWLQRFERLAATETPFPSLSSEAHVISIVLKGIYWRKPDFPLAMLLLERAEILWRIPLDSGSRLQLGVAIGFFVSGLASPISWYKTLNAYKPETGQLDFPAKNLQLLVYLAFSDCFAGLYTRSLQNVQQGLALVDHSDLDQNACLLRGCAVYNHLMLGDVQAADQYLEQIRLRVTQTEPGLNMAHYQLLLSWRALFEQNHEDAISHARIALSMAEAVGCVYGIARSHYGLAHALFANGEYLEAFQHLTQTCIRWGHGIHQQLLFDSRFTEAGFHLQQGNRQQALHLLQSALQQGIHQGWGLPLWARPSFAEPLLCLALEQDIASDYVQCLIRQLNLTPQYPALLAANWPMPVRIYTLGQFAILLHGKRVDLHQNASHRPLQLLKLIMAFGGKAITQIRLMDALWPDASGDAALSVFNTTLHRLRKLVGARAVLLKDGQVGLDKCLVWVDSLALEGILNALEHELLAKTTNLLEIDRLWSHLQQLHQGKFLENEPSSRWTLEATEKLENHIARLILMLGRFWEGRNEWEQAAECYRYGIEIDPLAERFHRHLMQAFIEQKHYAEALMTYEHYRKMLLAALNVMPGGEIVKLYTSIQKSHHLY